MPSANGIIYGGKFDQIIYRLICKGFTFKCVIPRSVYPNMAHVYIYVYTLYFLYIYVFFKTFLLVYFLNFYQ